MYNGEWWAKSNGEHHKHHKNAFQRDTNIVAKQIENKNSIELDIFIFYKIQTPLALIKFMANFIISIKTKIISNKKNAEANKKLPRLPIRIRYIYCNIRKIHRKSIYYPIETICREFNTVTPKKYCVI